MSLVTGKTNTSPPITILRILADDGAAVFIAGRLACRGELALGPIAIEVHGRLVGDDERGGVIPVASRSARIDKRAHLPKKLCRFLELRTLRRFLVPRSVDLAEQIGPALADQHGAEEVVLPVRLSAESKRDDAAGLEFLAGRNEFGKVFGGSTPASLKSFVL